MPIPGQRRRLKNLFGGGADKRAGRTWYGRRRKQEEFLPPSKLPLPNELVLEKTRGSAKADFSRMERRHDPAFSKRRRSRNKVRRFQRKWFRAHRLPHGRQVRPKGMRRG
jgi:hypothetical protein